MQVIHPKTNGVEALNIGWSPHSYAGRFRSPAWHYEMLCERFGSERINQAIRKRILSNRLWRAMMQELHKREAVAAGQP